MYFQYVDSFDFQKYFTFFSMRIQLHSLQLVHFEKSILTKKQYKETSPNSYGWFYDAVVSITDFESVHLGSNPSET